MSKAIYQLDRNFDYSRVGHFHTPKLDGIVSSKKIGLPLVDIFFIPPLVYRDWKTIGKLPPKGQKQISQATQELLTKYGRVTLRTCFKFVGLENPRGLLSWRNLSSSESVLTSVETAFKHGEAVARKNKIYRFELGLILMGRINAEKGGIILADLEKEKLCSLDVAWGDARLIAMGEGEWDTFWVNEKLTTVGKKIGRKAIGYFFHGKETKQIAVPKAKRDRPTLTDKEAVQLAHYAFQAARFHRNNVEIEFMIDRAGVLDMYELQVKPGIRVPPRSSRFGKRGVLVSGLGTCLGTVKGKIRLLKNEADFKKIRPGEIVVMHLPQADACLPIFTKAAAIITDLGGTTSHFATIARDFNVPCVVGTQKATSVLKNGQSVVVDGCKGEVCLNE